MQEYIYTRGLGKPSTSQHNIFWCFWIPSLPICVCELHSLFYMYLESLQFIKRASYLCSSMSSSSSSAFRCWYGHVKFGICGCSWWTGKWFAKFLMDLHSLSRKSCSPRRPQAKHKCTFFLVLLLILSSLVSAFGPVACLPSRNVFKLCSSSTDRLVLYCPCF